MITVNTEAANSSSESAGNPGYKKPDWFTKHLMNPLVNGLTRTGISVMGSRVLEHTGRKTGEVHHTPVNLLHLDGKQYLMSPRGETQWVRNVRAAEGRLILVKGRKRSEYQATEVTTDERIAILRAYLAKWKFEVGMFFDGVGPESSDDEIRAIANRHPVFILI
ncbi:MAG: nitroreductase family deazaflavin-dependent oxidoreductase [Acidimicrobiales bacterium]